MRAVPHRAAGAEKGVTAQSLGVDHMDPMGTTGLFQRSGLDVGDVTLTRP